MHKVIFFTILVFLGIACQKEDMTKPGLLVPLTVDQDPGLQSISLNETLLHIETHGNPTNPIIIMIHGGPGGDYRSLLKAKSFSNDGFFVVFYDQRGSGLSKREDKSQFEKKDAVQLYIDDLGGIIDHFQKSVNQKVFLIGHSWGAMLATAYVNQHPKRINGLVLAEPGGLTGHKPVNTWTGPIKLNFSQNHSMMPFSLSKFLPADQNMKSSITKHLFLLVLKTPPEIL